MRAVLQRVAHASVEVEGQITGSIERGLLVLIGVTDGDGPEQVKWMARKIATLRIFPDAEGRMNRSLLDIDGGALVVSQFTLYGDCRKGRRPSFVRAAHPDLAAPLVEQLGEALVAEGVGRVQHGIFGAHMAVSLLNDGPVTLILDTAE